MDKNKFCLLGLMSGSSLDGLDIAYCEFSLHPENKSIKDWHILCADTIPYTEAWVSRLAGLPQASALAYARTHAYFGHYMADMVNEFMSAHNIRPDFIASHGHTVFHEPERGMTAQIGDGASLAALTGIPVICDFRTTDIALFGQGAPLAPVADKFLFGGYDAYLNLGGIANISVRKGEDFIAFDVCAANQLLNALAAELGLTMDAGGQLAAQGTLNPELLEQSFSDDFFARPFPKSLGNQYVQSHFIPLFADSDLPLNDRLRTACGHIAVQVGRAVTASTRDLEMSTNGLQLLVTGGGAFNTFLVEQIRGQLSPMGITVVVPDENIVKYKEAALMAVLGLLRILRRPNAMKSVTGASRDSVGGCVYL